MEIVIILFTAAVVVAIALVAVGRVVGETTSQPAHTVFDSAEALSFVAEALPDDVTAELSYDEVTRLMRLHLEYVQMHHLAPEDPDDPAANLVVMGEEDPVDHILRRAGESKKPVERHHAQAVVTAQLAYFEAIGALDIEPPDPGSADPDT
ncbi:MAG: hypothetical protein GY745_20175 [Actinomycetia bacterium]|nr:hypothetical protein [Actinomycetes bacterium]MCP3913062.1 hypothetical protein [Actinomycetes bacterium]MCP4087340.1 hypothetical protein [Actinomycetes bacterium]